MALKDTWVDKRDNVDDVLAEDINGIARAVIELEDRTIPTKTSDLENDSNFVDKDTQELTYYYTAEQTDQKIAASGGGGGGGSGEIVTEQSGENILLTDASNQNIRGLQIFGKSTLTGGSAPGNQLANFPDVGETTANGLTWSSSNGEISMGGKKTVYNASSLDVGIWADIPIKEGDYTVSGSYGYTKVMVLITKSDGSSQTITAVGGEAQTFALIGTELGCKVYCAPDGSIQIPTEKVKPMVNKGLTALPWEPYESGEAIPSPDEPTDIKSIGDDGDVYVYVDSQTFVASTPSGISGIRVTSGGNYTDSNGQQWVCDEVDYEKGVVIKRIGRTTFTGSENIITTTLDGSPGYVYQVSNTTLGGRKQNTPVICSHYPESANGYNVLNSVYAGNAVNFNVEFSTLSAFKSWISEQYANGTPMEVYCILATPIETSIGASEIALFKKLYTSKPNTNINNTDGAWMTVKYVADTKAYIDKKFNELAAAIVSNS